jgi:hypothetical protein
MDQRIAVATNLPDPDAYKAPAGDGREPRGALARLGLFIRQVIDELRKSSPPPEVNWSTTPSWLLVFVLIMMGIITLF